MEPFLAPCLDPHFLGLQKKTIFTWMSLTEPSQWLRSDLEGCELEEGIEIPC